MRREFKFNDEEAAYLDTLSPEWETIKDGSHRWLLMHDFPIPEGYTVDKATAAVDIPLEYPIAQLDMVYFYPAIKRRDGKEIRQTQCPMTIDGKTFQRWSRHYTSAHPWDPNGDSIITHIMAIQNWLEREF